MEELIILKKISTNEEATTIIEILQKNDIEYFLEKEDNEEVELSGDMIFGLNITMHNLNLSRIATYGLLLNLLPS